MVDYAIEHVAARRVLLDALDALDSQRKAIILVGAQAVYLQTGDSGIAGFAPFTTDADLVLSPTQLDAHPLIEQLLGGASFNQRGNPGIWWKTVELNGEPTDIEVDLMVPDRFTPTSSRRSVSLPPHNRMIARRALGLEGSMLDHDIIEVGALESEDRRCYTIRVAGPAALVVAKVFKIRDRLAGGKADRIADKDAADVYRLMVAVPVHKFVSRLRPLLTDETAGEVCSEGVDLMLELFGARAAQGVRMAADALRLAVPSERIVDVCNGFVRDVRNAI